MTINNQQQINKKNLILSTEILQKNRLAYIDNLKALTIIWVIMVHVAVTYSGIGRWFYVEPKTLDNFSFYLFILFQSFNQAFFMSLFFLIAAYFIPSSLEKKGAKKFIQDRLFRLGVPTIIFMLLICPVLVKMAHPDINLFEFYKNGITSFSFLSWTGPMWFALILLIFSIIYVPINRLVIKFAGKYSFEINIKSALVLTALITITAFAIRLVYPIGTAVINIQLCFFAAYVFMFLLGAISYQKKLFETLTYSTAKILFVAAFVIGLPLWGVIIYFGFSKNGLQYSAISGGWNYYAFGYALWESFTCVAIIIGLIGIFKERFNTQTSLQKFLSINAFGVYVFHPLIVVGVSILLKNVNLYPLLKFIVVVLIAVPVSFIFASLIRKIRILQKIFS